MVWSRLEQIQGTRYSGYLRLVASSSSAITSCLKGGRGRRCRKRRKSSDEGEEEEEEDEDEEKEDEEEEEDLVSSGVRSSRMAGEGRASPDMV